MYCDSKAHEYLLSTPEDFPNRHKWLNKGARGLTTFFSQFRWSRCYKDQKWLALTLQWLCTGCGISIIGSQNLELKW